jgi:hypothetical protein
LDLEGEGLLALRSALEGVLGDGLIRYPGQHRQVD